MKTLKMFVLALLLGAFSLSVAPAADLQMTITASPSNPIAGEAVKYKVVMTGGNTPASAYEFQWNSTSNIETPGFIHLAPNCTETEVVYLTPGTKSVIVTGYSGGQVITRTLSFTVFEARIKLTTPNGGEVWQTGKFCPITYVTESILFPVNKVEITLFNLSYSPESNAYKQVLASDQPNVNAFYYMPPATGAVGKYFKVSVTGTDPNHPVAGALSENYFTIQLPTPPKPRR